MGDKPFDLVSVLVIDAQSTQLVFDNRFNKQQLLMDKYQTPIVEHLDAWVFIVCLANWLLYTASDEVEFVCQKWEKYLPESKNAKNDNQRKTIAQTRKAAKNLFHFSITKKRIFYLTLCIVYFFRKTQPHTTFPTEYRHFKKKKNGSQKNDPRHTKPTHRPMPCPR